MSSLSSLEKVSLSYDHWSLRKWRIKIENLWVFLRIFLRRKYILTYPMQLGVLGCTSVEPITPGLSQRGHLLGAVAQWQLRLCFYFQSLSIFLSSQLVNLIHLSLSSRRWGIWWFIITKTKLPNQSHVNKAWTIIVFQSWKLVLFKSEFAGKYLQFKEVKSPL